MRPDAASYAVQQNPPLSSGDPDQDMVILIMCQLPTPRAPLIEQGQSLKLDGAWRKLHGVLHNHNSEAGKSSILVGKDRLTVSYSGDSLRQSDILLRIQVRCRLAKRRVATTACSRAWSKVICPSRYAINSGTPMAR